MEREKTLIEFERRLEEALKDESSSSRYSRLVMLLYELETGFNIPIFRVSEWESEHRDVMDLYERVWEALWS